MKFTKVIDGYPNRGGDWYDDDKGVRHPIIEPIDVTRPMVLFDDGVYIGKMEAEDYERMSELLADIGDAIRRQKEVT